MSKRLKARKLAKPRQVSRSTALVKRSELKAIDRQIAQRRDILPSRRRDGAITGGKPPIPPERGQGQQTITCPYVLHIHGKPVAFAMGEQEYYDSNEQQTYGDALESTVASALRRCAKRLGVGLELWGQDFLRALPPPAAASTPRQGEAPPRQYQAPPPERPAAHHAARGEPITDKQRKRLWG